MLTGREEGRVQEANIEGSGERREERGRGECRPALRALRRSGPHLSYIGVLVRPVHRTHLALLHRARTLMAEGGGVQTVPYCTHTPGYAFAVIGVPAGAGGGGGGGQWGGRRHQGSQCGGGRCHERRQCGGRGPALSGARGDGRGGRRPRVSSLRGAWCGGSSWA
jgi:hypothetical protein